MKKIYRKLKTVEDVFKRNND